MVWLVVAIVVIVGIYSFKFLVSIMEDDRELGFQSLQEKFRFIINLINVEAFKGLGTITVVDKNGFNLYQPGENQIINFHYSTGHLTITWKYKYFQKEVVCERTFENVRNLSIFEQENIAKRLIAEVRQKIYKHKRLVTDEKIQELKKPTTPEVDPGLEEVSISKKDALFLLGINIENGLRDSLNESLSGNKNMPKIMLGMMLMKSATIYSENLKDKFPGLKNHLHSKYPNIKIFNQDYFELVDEITQKVLIEFIE